MGPVLVCLHRTRSRDVRCGFLTLFGLMQEAENTGLPASVAAAIAGQHVSLKAGNGYLGPLLAEVLAPAGERQQ